MTAAPSAPLQQHTCVTASPQLLLSCKPMVAHALSLVPCHAGLDAAADEGLDSADAAYMSKIQMLRELGFLNVAVPEAEALTQSQGLTADVQPGTSSSPEQGIDASGLPDTPAAGRDANAEQQEPLPARKLITGKPGLKTPEQRCCSSSTFCWQNVLFDLMPHHAHRSAAARQCMAAM